LDGERRQAGLYLQIARRALKWHDGLPVRAVDVVASLKRWGVRNDSYGQPLLAAASAIEATGDNEFRIALKAPFPVLEALGTLTSPGPFMLPERLAQTDPFTQIKEAIGSGPFKMAMAEWRPGHQVVYAKNGDYVPRAEPPLWATGGKRAKLDRVEWNYIPDPLTAWQCRGRGRLLGEPRERCCADGLARPECVDQRLARLGRHGALQPPLSAARQH